MAIKSKIRHSLYLLLHRFRILFGLWILRLEHRYLLWSMKRRPAMSYGRRLSVRTHPILFAAESAYVMVVAMRRFITLISSRRREKSLQAIDQSLRQGDFYNDR